MNTIKLINQIKRSLYDQKKIVKTKQEKDGIVIEAFDDLRPTPKPLGLLQETRPDFLRGIDISGLT